MRYKSNKQCVEYERLTSPLRRSTYEASIRGIVKRLNGHWLEAGIVNEDGTPFTVEEYDFAYGLQGGRCALCGEKGINQYDAKLSKKQVKKNQMLVPDHKHSSGKFRSLLCWSCNMFIGKLESKLHLQAEALRYLGVVA